MSIWVTRSSMPPYDEFCKEIRKLWDTCLLTNMGELHRQFQHELEEYLSCPHVALFTNGHLALESVISAMHFPAGGEVITTPFTFISTTHAIVRSGLTPVFCDINPVDYTMDVNRIEELITEKTAAIIPVHVYGNMCDVERIQQIADKHKLVVIYDAAHAFGVKFKGEALSNFGDASILSFHATKVFNTIEGGAVCFRSNEYVKILDDIKNYGIRGPERVVYVGGNAKMSEFQAAMGICNLRYFEQEISKRKLVYQRYREHLNGVPGIRLCGPQRDVEPNYAYFPVVFDGFGASRDEIFNLLKAHDIMARKYFYPLTNDVDCYADLPTAGKEKTPEAAFTADRVITLPMYADLAMEDVDRICELILSCRTDGSR